MELLSKEQTFTKPRDVVRRLFSDRLSTTKKRGDVSIPHREDPTDGAFTGCLGGPLEGSE